MTKQKIHVIIHSVKTHRNEMMLLSSYNFSMQSDILYVLNTYNEHSFYPRLTLLDGSILLLVKSFCTANTKFYMSNIEIGKLLLSDPKTVQHSIDRLVEVGLVTKETVYTNGRKKRYLQYQEMGLQSIIDICKNDTLRA